MLDCWRGFYAFVKGEKGLQEKVVWMTAEEHEERLEDRYEAWVFGKLPAGGEGMTCG